MEFQYSVQTAKPVSEAITAIEAALAEQKFSVLWHLHINSKLAEKGLSLNAADADVHVLEVCSAPKAKIALDTNPAVASFLPCKIVVRREGGQTHMELPRPTALIGILGDDRLKGLAEEVEAVLVAAVEAAK